MEIVNHRLVAGAGEPRVQVDDSPNTGGQMRGGKPQFLVIHYTAGGTASSAVRVFKNTTPGSRVSAHLVIDHDGTITQMVPFDTVSFHAGRSRWRGKNGLNAFSVGIEIVNWGKLTRDANGTWRSWTGAMVPAERVILAEHKNHPGGTFGWEIFDEAQIEATLDAARAIVSAYGMDEWDLIGHDDVSPIRKIDPGPAFDIDSFRAMVFGEEGGSDTTLFKVDSDTGLNLRIAPALDAQKIKNLANGAPVRVIERSGPWWLVAEIRNKQDDTTGYVHSRWLTPA